MPLNAPEKVVALYLRLNGFFLMPHFTVFSSEFPEQKDLLAIRLPDAQEQVGDRKLPTDSFFLEAMSKPDDRTCIIAEVKGNEHWKDAEDQLNRAFPYSVTMYGKDSQVQKVVFCQQRDCILKSGEVTRVSVEHCLSWIIGRLMETERIAKEAETVSKYGSWTWSEDFLADLLFLSRLGAKLTINHSCKLSKTAPSLNR